MYSGFNYICLTCPSISNYHLSYLILRTPHKLRSDSPHTMSTRKFEPLLNGNGGRKKCCSVVKPLLFCIIILRNTRLGRTRALDKRDQVMFAKEDQPPGSTGWSSYYFDPPLPSPGKLGIGIVRQTKGPLTCALLLLTSAEVSLARFSSRASFFLSANFLCTRDAFWNLIKIWYFFYIVHSFHFNDILGGPGQHWRKSLMN